MTSTEQEFVHDANVKLDRVATFRLEKRLESFTELLKHFIQYPEYMIPKLATAINKKNAEMNRVICTNVNLYSRDERENFQSNLGKFDGIFNHLY